jgi:hypothetical protein
MQVLYATRSYDIAEHYRPTHPRDTHHILYFFAAKGSAQRKGNLKDEKARYCSCS